MKCFNHGLPLVTLLLVLQYVSAAVVLRHASITEESPESGLCCTFDSHSVCDWSPSYLANGWLWSGFVPPTEPIPPKDSSFIFIEDGSGGAVSSDIYEVTEGTSFTFSYFFNTSNPNQFNRFEIGFVNSAAVTVAFIENMDIVNDWTTFTVTCDDTCCYDTAPACPDDSCCSDSIPKCQGQFYLRVLNSPNVELIAALDDFSVNGAQCW